MPIPPCTADFLVVTFQAAWKGGVNHSADVGFIDAHAEGRGRYHDIRLAVHELFLHPPSPLRVEPGMIARHLKITRPGACESLGLFARGRVDDGRAVGRLTEDGKRELWPMRGQCLHNLDTDIFPAKAVDEML